MDIGLDTIVYLVLGVIFVLAQLNRKKKKASPPPVEEMPADLPPESEQTPLGEIWNQFWNEEEEKEQPKEELRPVNIIPPVISRPATTRYESGKFKTEPMIDVYLEDDLTKMDQRLIYGDSSVETPKSYEAFDLRTAIIYSTILERKYV